MVTQRGKKVKKVKLRVMNYQKAALQTSRIATSTLDPEWEP